MKKFEKRWKKYPQTTQSLLKVFFCLSIGNCKTGISNPEIVYCLIIIKKAVHREMNGLKK
jgi:hypothetical protein